MSKLFSDIFKYDNTTPFLVRYKNKNKIHFTDKDFRKMSSNIFKKNNGIKYG